MANDLEHSRYLQALGLFTMARRHAERADEYRNELHALLGIETGSHVEDAIWSGGPIDIPEFDEALRREGFNVASRS